VLILVVKLEIFIFKNNKNKYEKVTEIIIPEGITKINDYSFTDLMLLRRLSYLKV
jgi:hypothetical protein